MNTYGLKPTRIINEALVCPDCQNGLHQSDADVCFRSEQDSDTGWHVEVNSRFAKVDSDMRSNPSFRRDGLKIKFWCEICRGEFTLEILQNKGETLIGWRINEK